MRLQFKWPRKVFGNEAGAVRLVQSPAGVKNPLQSHQLVSYVHTMPDALL